MSLQPRPSNAGAPLRRGDTKSDHSKRTIHLVGGWKGTGTTYAWEQMNSVRKLGDAIAGVLERYELASVG
jgi:hypothetical protein